MPLFEKFNLLRRHKALRSVGLYTVSNFLTKSASFLLVFIFTNPRFITPAENGMLSLFNNFALFLKPIMMLGIIHSVGVDFFKLDKNTFRDSFTTGFFLSVLVAVLILVAFFLFRGYLNHQYGFSNGIIVAIPLVTFLFICFEQLQNILRSEQKPEMFMGASMTRLILEFGTSVILVVFFSWHWYGRIAGLLISQGTLTLFAVYYFFRQGYLGGVVRKEFIRSEITYAFPVIALQMTFFAINSSDKFFLSHFTRDNALLGIYSFASVFASVVFTLHLALIQYFFPKIYSVLSADTTDYYSIRKQFYFYAAIMAVGTIGLIAGAPLAYHFVVNKAYLPALDYFYLFCIGYFLWSISYFFFSFLFYHKNKTKILLLSLSGILTSVSLNYYGILHRSAFGGAAAIAISCFLILLYTLIANAREVKLVFTSKKAS
jgi:hypothetical protein